MVSRAWLEDQFPGRRARIAAIVIAVMVLVVLAWSALELRSRHAFLENRLEQIAPRHARLSGLIEDQQLVQQALALSREELSRYVYFADVPVDRVGIDLQQRVRGIVERSGTSVISSRILPTREEEHFHVVAVSVTTVATAGQLREVMMALAREEPSIQVDSANLTQARGAGSGVMSVTLIVSVLHLKS